MKDFDIELKKILAELCDQKRYNDFYRKAGVNEPMPSVEKLKEFMNLMREIIFPGYYGSSNLNFAESYIGVNLDKAFNILSKQIKRGLCFNCEITKSLTECNNCEVSSNEMSLSFFKKIPEIREKLSTDVISAFNGDPAAKSYGEIIFCYPSILVMTYHRIAHELLKLNVPLIPRIISELAHSATGIDIHPGATIGEYFTIDHGTGVVIGETCIIGNNVKLYQGVTLGAKSFPLDENGNPIKGIARHPIVEDDVVIYAEATILGRITIGKGSIIGGNVCVTKTLPSYSKVLQSKDKVISLIDGAGI